jgi:hypothetical protein
MVIFMIMACAFAVCHLSFSPLCVIFRSLPVSAKPRLSFLSGETEPDSSVAIACCNFRPAPTDGQGSTGARRVIGGARAGPVLQNSLTAAGAAVQSNFSFQGVKIGRIATISRLDRGGEPARRANRGVLTGVLLRGGAQWQPRRQPFL